MIEGNAVYKNYALGRITEKITFGKVPADTFLSTPISHSINEYQLVADAQRDGFPHFAVSAFIEKIDPDTGEKKVLLLKRQKGKRYEEKWELPGGKLSKLEGLRRKLVAGLAREVL